MTREQRELLRAVLDEKVYLSHGGAILRWARGGQNRRCDKTIRRMVALGWVVGPPEGASFFQATDDGLTAWKAAA